jgi:hypothetical protein
MNVGDLVSRVNEIGIIIDMTIDTLPELAIVLWSGDKVEHLYTDELEFIDHDKEKL